MFYSKNNQRLVYPCIWRLRSSLRTCRIPEMETFVPRRNEISVISSPTVFVGSESWVSGACNLLNLYRCVFFSKTSFIVCCSRVYQRDCELKIVYIFVTIKQPQTFQQKNGIPPDQIQTQPFLLRSC